MSLVSLVKPSAASELDERATRRDATIATRAPRWRRLLATLQNLLTSRLLFHRLFFRHPPLPEWTIITTSLNTPLAALYKPWSHRTSHAPHTTTHAPHYHFRAERSANRSSLRSCSTKMKTRVQYGPKRR